MKTVLMFPGQGAQSVGMGKELIQTHPQAAELFKKASAVLGYDLGDLCLNGPEEKLNQTEYAQPAIFVHSAAALAVMQTGGLGGELAVLAADACAGLSLGEYTALYAAGALSFEDGVRLVQLRGQSMQEAARLRQGTMVSLLGIDEAGSEKLCQAVREERIAEEDGLEAIVCPVNFNCPGQIVLSGSMKACERAAGRAQEFGAQRAIPLKVAGAFHTKMMAPAAEKLGRALAGVALKEMQCPVIANVNALPYAGKAAIAQTLLGQLTGAVRWQQSVEYLLKEGYGRLVEIGPGRVLNGLVKKTARQMKMDAEIINVG